VGARALRGLAIVAVLKALGNAACIGDGIANEGQLLDIRPGDRVVMFGDSNTTSPYFWWHPLRDAVNAKFAARGLPAVTWIDSGNPGDRTTHVDTPAAIASRVTDHNPNVVIIALGTNNVGNTALPTSQASITSILVQLLAWNPNLRIMWVAPFIRDGSTIIANGDTPLGPELRTFRDALAVICRDHGVVFVDARAYWDRLTQPEATATTGDGIHVSNPAGRAFASNKALFQINARTE
jgi:hypothetical protein